MSSRIYIVEDNDIMREMLWAFISDQEDMEVCGAAGTAEEALRAIPAIGADLLLIDISLPEMTGFDLISQIRETSPELPCLILSGHGEAAYVERSRTVGAHGYVLKGNPHEILRAIRRVLDGNRYNTAPLR